MIYLSKMMIFHSYVKDACQSKLSHSFGFQLPVQWQEWFSIAMLTNQTVPLLSNRTKD